jgi:hypothetical protein
VRIIIFCKNFHHVSKGKRNLSIKIKATLHFIPDPAAPTNEDTNISGVDNVASDICWAISLAW